MQGDLATLLRAHVIEAIKAGRKPFVELGAKWCAPCRALDASLHDPAMIDAFRGTAIFKIDVDEWRAQLRAVRLPAEGAIPAFYRLDNAGRVTAVRIDGEAWGADLPKNMAPPLKAFFSKR
jgi:thiol-disulfide isomerase/thioredoxin